MDNIRWHHPQLPVPLRFSISLEQWYLENQLSSGSAAERTMTLSLPMGFRLSVTQLQPQCFDCNAASTPRNATELKSVDGLAPQVVELYLLLPRLTHSALFADIIKDVRAAHFAEIYEDGYLDLEKVRTLKQPFGRMLLVKFLQDVVRSTDVSYVATKSPDASLRDSPMACPTMPFVPNQASLTVVSTHGSPGVHAHCAIMKQWPVFANLLQKQKRLWDEPTVQVLLDIDPNVMQLIINFIYLGQIEGPGYVGIVDWRQIYQTSRRFQVNHLADLALDKMCREMLPENILPTLFQWGYQHPDFDKKLLELAFANREKLLAPGNSSFNQNLFRLDGFQQLKDVDEPWEATEIRHTLFNKEWGLMSSRIESVMLNMNTIALSAIYDFVDSAYTVKATRALMPFQELPTGLIFAGINVPDHDLLFQQIARTISSSTAPTMEPTSSVTSQSGTNAMSSQPGNGNNHVIILQSKDCVNLKTAMKSMIDQFVGLAIEGAINPLEAGLKLPAYDMIVLERWYQSLCDLRENDPDMRTPTLVVIIQDFESFDQDVLQDLITICSNYLDRIPFVFLMGLATSIDALHQSLPKSVLSLLQTRKFQMQQSSECLTAVIEDLFIHAKVGLMVGPLPLKQLIDQFMHYNFSIGGFVANLKYIVMHHFYANPLSILCDRSLNPNSKALDLLRKGHFDHIRMLPSFQRYVESKVDNDPQVAEMLLLDDEFLTLQIPDMVKDIQEYQRNFAIIFDFLWFLQSRFSISVLKKSKRALYFMALEGTLTNSSNITFLLSLVRKMDSNSMMVFIEDCLQFFNDLPQYTSKSKQLEDTINRDLLTLQSIRDRMIALLEVVSDDSAASEDEAEGTDQAEQNDENGDEDEALEEVVQVPVPDRWTKSNTKTPTTLKKRKLVSVKANMMDGRQTKIAKKTRETVRIPKGALGTYTVLVTEIDQFFEKLFKTYLDCHVNMPLYEIFYYSQVKIQQKAFLPQPRASIQTALGQPELYLNCDCCHPPSGAEGASTSRAEMVLPTQHDVCILYKLYVECGRLINMYDWFTAFGMILERGVGVEGDGGDDGNGDEGADSSGRAKKRAKVQPKKATKKKSEESVKKEGLDQKEVQARFISGVAELQFMGFIKPTNRKTDHVQRLTWGSI
ncbi:Origin recognition complex subunit 3 [Entomortierella chlamydospora]|nr:Origin recognition complex subunit 3 [Entomortierella chlamydospora]